MSARRRRLRLALVALGLLAVLGLAAVLPAPRTTTLPLAPDSTAPSGARAAARILEREGVRVREARTLAQVEQLAGPGTTVLVADHTHLTGEEARRLAATGADLVLLDPGNLVADYGAPVSAEGWEWTQGPVPAACTDPEALAAEELEWSGVGFSSSDPQVELCFPGPEGRAGLAVWDGASHVAALAVSEPLTNAHLEEHGNAALVLRLLGRHSDLVWFLPRSASGATQAPDVVSTIPRWLQLVGLQGLVVAAVVAVWRGRRTGRLVTEPLPVVVQSSEVTRGRARLYRRARAHGHAAASLRAGTASRCARRLGLPRSAGATVLVDAVSRASGRPAHEVERLLYGPPPTSDRRLTDLARELDRLESEVHRP